MPILVVDDDVFMLGIVERQLEALGYEDITACTDSREALGLLKLEPGRFETLVLDLNMPGLDGIQFLKNMPEGFDGRIIVISGEHEDVRDWATETGAERHLNVVGHLTKPPQREELVKLIGEFA